MRKEEKEQIGEQSPSRMVPPPREGEKLRHGDTGSEKMRMHGRLAPGDSLATRSTSPVIPQMSVSRQKAKQDFDRFSQV